MRVWCSPARVQLALRQQGAALVRRLGLVLEPVRETPGATPLAGANLGDGFLKRDTEGCHARPAAPNRS